MPTRIASCSCGQLTAEVTGEPVRISICHCLACQRRTGGPFAEQARYPREHVTVSGTSTEFARAGDEGPGAKFHFCPTCGATVYYELLDPQMSAFLAIPVGAFADPDFPTPRVSVYEGRKHKWVIPPPEAEHFP
jgi:hypothetical protein